MVVVFLTAYRYCWYVKKLNRRPEYDSKNENENSSGFIKNHFRERKSQKTVFGMPLWHIGKNARGFIALGLNARGFIAIGLKARGIISLGAIAVGDYSVGALAIGKYFALGDNARAMVALGDTHAAGTVFQKVGDLTAQDYTAAKNALDSVVPSYLTWAKEIIKLFL